MRNLILLLIENIFPNLNLILAYFFYFKIILERKKETKSNKVEILATIRMNIKMFI